MVRVRNDLAAIFPGGEFLLPTKTDNGSVVGLRFADRTILAEDGTYWAYHSLMEEAVKQIL